MSSDGFYVAGLLPSRGFWQAHFISPMADKQPIFFTFHKIREQGEQGSSDAWRAFLDLYSPLYLHLLALYLGDDSRRAEDIWKKTLLALTAGNYERFRATPRQSEREFLSDVRALLLDTLFDAAPDRAVAQEGGALALDAESFTKLIEGLPLLHQEMLFLRMTGYTDATVELVLRVAPHVAQAAFERLAPDYGAAQHIEKDLCLWPGEWLAVLHRARGSRTDKCPELHQFLRIHDGQVSWYDKEPVEKHVSGCLHCLEAWIALREVGYWRRHAPPMPPAQIEEFVKTLASAGVLAPPPKKSFLRRVFS